VTTALSAAGAISEGGAFVFAGFLPSKAAEREAAVGALAGESRAGVLHEAPHRKESMGKALTPLVARNATLARELTKQFEQVETLECDRLASWLEADAQRIRGEFVVVLHPQACAKSNDEGLRVLSLLVAELPLKTAVKLAAEITGAPRNDLYEAALKMKDGAG
jgi:16S rRNA (cytidine1402-2'-O)-methyltransferase